MRIRPTVIPLTPLPTVPFAFSLALPFLRQIPSSGSRLCIWFSRWLDDGLDFPDMNFFLFFREALVLNMEACPGDPQCPLGPRRGRPSICARRSALGFICCSIRGAGHRLARLTSRCSERSATAVIPSSSSSSRRRCR